MEEEYQIIEKIKEGMYRAQRGDVLYLVGEIQGEKKNGLFIYEQVTVEGVPHVVMENAVPLEEHVKKNAPLSAYEAIEIIEDILLRAPGESPEELYMSENGVKLNPYAVAEMPEQYKNDNPLYYIGVLLMEYMSEGREDGNIPLNIKKIIQKCMNGDYTTETLLADLAQIHPLADDVGDTILFSGLNDYIDKKSKNETPPAEPENDEETDMAAEKKKKRRTRIIMFSALAAAVIVIIILIVFAVKLFRVDTELAEETSTEEETQTLGEPPDMTGINVTTAQKKLEAAGYEVNVEYIESSETEGVVLSQSYEDGVVTLTVSGGLETVELDDYSGVDSDKAQTILETLGFTVTVTEENSDTVDSGYVIETNPEAGSDVVEGEEIELIVSSGPAITYVSVPSCIGKSESTAKSLCTESGLSVSVVYEEDADNVGKVSAQSISSGTSVQSGTSITLTVGTEPETETTIATVTMPNCVGLSEESATELCENKGLKVKIKYETTSKSSYDDKVTEQSVSSGESVDEGTSVTLTVGVYEEETTSNTVTVPDCLGLSESKAQKKCENLGLTVKIEYVEDSTYVGLVTAQSLSSGTTIAKGATITLYVGIEPETETEIITEAETAETDEDSDE